MRRFLYNSFVTFSFTILIIPRSFSTSINFHDSISINVVVSDNDTIPATDNFTFFVSNKGSDSNDGRSATTPKLSITSVGKLLSNSSTGSSGAIINLEGSSLFREQFDATQNNVQVRSFGLTNASQLAKITGMDVIKGWDKTINADNVYNHLLKHSIDLSSPAYNYIIISEVDTVLERTNPISATKYLTYVPTIEQCKNSSGTYYTSNVTVNPIMVYMHPTEGAPGKNKFRYEATTRNYNVGGFYTDNAVYKNIYFHASGNGYGMLAAGKNTLIKNSIFQGGGTHSAVIKSGTIDSCLFLPGPKGLSDGIAAVFYNTEGKDDYNKISNTIFLDARTAVYTHTNGNINHKSLILNNVYAFADTTAAVNGLSAYDTDSVDVSNCYVEGYPTGWYGGATKLNIKNSIFRNTNQSAMLILSKANVTAQVNISNVLIKTNGNDQNQNAANGWVAYGVRSIYSNVNVEMTNSIIHDFSTWHAPLQAVITVQVAGFLKANHNIYICDVNNNNSVYMYQANNIGGRGTSSNILSDYNAFVLLRGSKFNWTAAPNNNGESSLATLLEWQSLTGQDKNSIVIDLRNNPLGLKAIFVDPDNGNYSLKQTLQADSIRQISAGTTNPPLFYPKRPLLENDGMPFKTPGGLSSFNGTVNSETESALKWQTFNESEFSSFIVEYSYDGIHFLEAGGLKAINDSKDNNYQFIHTHDRIDSIYYRLKTVYTDSSSLPSSLIKIYSDFSQEFKIIVYPNPFKHSITVEHPRRDAGTIRIFNYEGRLLKITNVVARTSHTLISLSNLSSGNYFVQWSSGVEKLSMAITK